VHPSTAICATFVERNHNCQENNWIQANVSPILPGKRPEKPEERRTRVRNREAEKKMNVCTNKDATYGYGREQAWQLLTEWTQSENLRKHALGVEACVAAMGEAEAVRLGLAGPE